MDKFKVRVSGNLEGEVPPEDWLVDEAEKAGWSDDPGTGHAILAPDERGAPGYEILNPIPIAPPIGWEPTPPIDELIRERVKAEMDRLKGEDEIDDIVDAEDFDVPDELPALETMYEFIAMEDQAPALKEAEVSHADRVKAELDYEEAKELERKVRQRRARAEYERRQKEHEDLYGPSRAVQEALKRRGDDEGA